MIVCWNWDKLMYQYRIAQYRFSIKLLALLGLCFCFLHHFCDISIRGKLLMGCGMLPLKTQCFFSIFKLCKMAENSLCGLYSLISECYNGTPQVIWDAFIAYIHVESLLPFSTICPENWKEIMIRTGDMGCVHCWHPNKGFWKEEKQKAGSSRFQGWSYEEDESEEIIIITWNMRHNL